MKKISKISVMLVTFILVLSAVLSSFAASEKYTPYQFGDDNIISRAATIAKPEKFEDIAAMKETYPRPQNVMFNVDENGNVTDMGKTIDEILEAVTDSMVPIFCYENEATADFLKNYFKKNKKSDVMFCSKNAELVKEVKNSNRKTVGIIDFTDTTDTGKETLNNMVYTANQNLAKTVIISDKIATKDIVEYLQKRVITVWVEETTDKPAKLHGAIQTGANGIVTDTPKELNNAYEFYKDDINLFVRKPFVVGHRGLPSKAPENTLESAKAAVKAGVDIVELDVRLTKDKEIVIYHENDLKNITTGSGDTTTRTLEEIKSYTVKSSVNYGPFPEYTNCKMPTLKEYFDEFKNNENVFFFVEIKANSTELVELTCKMIEEYGLKHRVAVLSFYSNLMATIKKCLPGVSCGVFSAEVSGADYQDSVKNFMSQYGISNLTYHASNVRNMYVIRALMYRGITTWPWTYGPGTTVPAYFLGVAGITTDAGDVCSDIPVKIEVGQELSQKVAPGSTIKFKPVVKTRVGEYKLSKPELVLVDGDGIITIDGDKIKTNSVGTAYAMYRLEANAAGENGQDSTKMTIYSELIEICVDESAPKKGCGGTISTAIPVVLLAMTCFLMKKKNEI